ncbi:MAG: arginase family protein [Anaerolineae bacterium]|nr:arginase family protein [Anaerolineae bacterium]
MSTRKIHILEAPSNLGLRPLRPGHIPGVWQLPQALQRQGLAERLNAVQAGRVEAPVYQAEADALSGFLNGPAIAVYSERLAEHLTPLIQTNNFPLVLGGDCSILLGDLLALRSRGDYGLCFIDGHNDFSYPRDENRKGRYTAAGLDLALACGYGPESLTQQRGLGPYVRESNVVALGFYNDPADAADFDTDSIYHTGIHILDVEAVQSMGAPDAALAARRHLEALPINGFWIHLDVDVLDQTCLPAVDSPNPRGLDWDELAAVLETLLASPAACGMEITIFDPDLDPDGRYAARLVDVLAASFLKLK